ncbi:MULTISPECIES: winged helix-turn-helix transcriptional regulator [Erwinia]|uniref:HVO_A0114 family putative DNA-binding protein n=1 Tax=Erwinia TaxID=551 RepID=UPI00105F4D9C|nr:winged helix-turn-helix transcriptional regulator [Erwinia aphidicola]MCP2231693.1 putative transcriptional regulator [Erwinia aphidicola]
MRTLTINISTIEETQRRTLAAIKGDVKARGDFLSFTSWDLLHKVLTPKCMNILNAMTGEGNLSVREVARRVGRDIKGVHTDVKKLLSHGVIEHGPDGIQFPFDEIRFDFSLGHAAA